MPRVPSPSASPPPPFQRSRSAPASTSSSRPSRRSLRLDEPALTTSTFTGARSHAGCRNAPAAKAACVLPGPRCPVQACPVEDSRAHRGTRPRTFDPCRPGPWQVPSRPPASGSLSHRRVGRGASMNASSQSLRLHDEQWRAVVAAAGAAPSTHNTQPWRFVVEPDAIHLHLDPSRALPVIDPTGREARISCGAALLNLRLALRALDLEPVVTLLPQ